MVKDWFEKKIGALKWKAHSIKSGYSVRLYRGYHPKRKFKHLGKGWIVERKRRKK